VAGELEAARSAAHERATSPLIHNEGVQKAVAAVGPGMMRRASPFPARHAAQQAALQLPRFCTTTIGSFPQTPEVRSWRAQFRKGQLSKEQYEALLGGEMENCVRAQEELGLDVLVHGEFKRTDMVEYFGENLRGFAFTATGWVQSYGSRCVKPPIIFGDVSCAPAHDCWLGHQSPGPHPQAHEGDAHGPSHLPPGPSPIPFLANPILHLLLPKVQCSVLSQEVALLWWRLASGTPGTIMDSLLHSTTCVMQCRIACRSQLWGCQVLCCAVVFAASSRCTPLPPLFPSRAPGWCLQWSFVRDDQARRVTAYQLALAMRQEVQDLEAQGSKSFRWTEAAIREGLPLRPRGLGGVPAVGGGRVSSPARGSGDETQIHTHMCYSGLQ